MFLAKSWRRLKGGRKQEWYALRATVWDKEHKRPRQIHVAYVGIARVIPESKAREIARKAARKLGIPEAEAWEKLKRVRRLRIVADEAKASVREEKPETLTLQAHLKERSK